MEEGLLWIIEDEVSKVCPDVDMEKLLSNIKRRILHGEYWKQ